MASSVTAAEFEHMLAALLSADNHLREAAERKLDMMKAEPNALLTYLMQFLRRAPSPHERTLCAVLLRRVLTQEDVSLFPSAAEPVRAATKHELLACLTEEPDPSLRRKMCDIIGELGMGVLESGEWPELLPFLLHCVQSPRPELRESALHIYAILAYYISEHLQGELPAMRAVFEACLADRSSEGRVMVRALHALGQLLICLEREEHLEVFQPLLPRVLGAVSDLLNMRQGGLAAEALELLIDVAEMRSHFFKPALEPLLAAMVTVARAAELSSGLRQRAVELLVAVAENARVAVRKMRGNMFVEQAVPMLFALMLEVRDAPEWETRGDDDDAGTVVEAAESALDRLAMAIKTNKFMPVALRILPQFLAAPDWRCRHAALRAMAQFASVIPDEPEQRQMAVGSVLKYFSDEHPRVRWAAVNAVGQFASDLAPDLQQETHTAVLPALLGAVTDPSRRVRVHALSALGNYVDHLPPDVLVSYLDGLLSSLLVVLQSADREVREEAVSCLSSVACSAEGAFAPYYDTFMPPLKTVLQQCMRKEDQELLGKALECMSLIGKAVGKERFGPDALAMMDALARIPLEEDSGDDALRGYMLQAWTRVCSTLGADFTPYLHLVMPLLFKAARQEVTEVLPGDDNEQERHAEEEEEEEEEEDDDEEDEIVRVEGKRVRIHTSALEVKETACRMLALFVADLQECFLPYVEESALLLAPMIEDSMFDKIRTSAVCAMPNLVAAAVKGARSEEDLLLASKIFDFAMKKLMSSMVDERSADMQLVLVQAAHMCIDACAAIPGSDPLAYREVVGREQLQEIANAGLAVLSACHQRRAVRLAESVVEEYDEEAHEEVEEENNRDEQVAFQVSELVGVLLKTHRRTAPDVVLPVFLDCALQMGSPDWAADERRIALFIIDDMIEFGGPAVLPLLPRFLPLLLAGLQAEEVGLRRAAAFGVGVAAQVSGDAFAPFLPAAVEALCGNVRARPADDEQDEGKAYDNVVAALGKVLQSHEGRIDRLLFRLWLSSMPLRHDTVEAASVGAQLCGLVERNHAGVLGEAGANIPLVLVALVYLLPLQDDKLTPRVLALLRAMQQQVPESMLREAWGALSPDMQRVLQGALASS